MGLTSLRRIGLAVLLLALVACTDGDDDAASSTTTTTEAPTTTEPAGPPDPDVSDAPTAAEGPHGGSRYLAYVRAVGDEAAQVVVADLARGTTRVVATTTRAGAGEPAVSPTGRVAWVAGEGAAARLVIDGPYRPVEVADPTAGCPQWLPGGDLVATVEADGGTLVRVEPTTGAVAPLPVDLGGAVCAAPAGPDHVVFPRAIGESYGPGGSEIVRAALDGSTSEVVGHVPGLCYANEIRATAGGDRIAAGVLCEPDRSGAGIWVGSLDDDLAPLVAENPPGTTTPDGSQYWSPTWSADGSAIAYQRSDQTGPRSASGHIWLADGTDGRTALVTRTEAWQPSLSPPTGGGWD